MYVFLQKKFLKKPGKNGKRIAIHQRKKLNIGLETLLTKSKKYLKNKKQFFTFADENLKIITVHLATHA